MSRKARDMDVDTDAPLSVSFGIEILNQGQITIPNIILNYKNKLGISDEELLFIIYVLQYRWCYDDPYPPVHTIAERMGKTVRQVQRYIQSLRSQGYLCIVEQSVGDGGQTTHGYDFGPLISAAASAARAERAERKI